MWAPVSEGSRNAPQTSTVGGKQVESWVSTGQRGEKLLAAGAKVKNTSEAASIPVPNHTGFGSAQQRDPGEELAGGWGEQAGTRRQVQRWIPKIGSEGLRGGRGWGEKERGCVQGRIRHRKR